MSSADQGAQRVRPADVEGWFTELGLTPAERADRDGIASWDLVLDGRRRFDLRMTVILDPSLAVICWAQYAPPISDMFRKSYRRLLRWNDEFPFAKFAIAEDERPVLTTELPIERLDRDELGLTMAQLAIAWVLQNDNVAAAIIGASRPEQVKENVAATGVRLEPELLRRIDEALGDVVIRDPGRTAENAPKSR